MRRPTIWPFSLPIAMAAFAILFGTRHIDTTEHQHGMMLAIAVESIVKLVAFVAVGAVRHLHLARRAGRRFTKAAAAKPASRRPLRARASMAGAGSP